MRRFVRWIMNGLSLVSLLLCIAAVGLWVRGQFVTDCFGHQGIHSDALSSGASSYVLSSSRGSLVLRADRSWQTYTGPSPAMLYSVPTSAVTRWTGGPGRLVVAFGPTSRGWQGLGFAYIHSGGGSPSSYLGSWTVQCPHWAIVALTAWLPILSLRRWFKREPREGMCAVCGYDLRATPQRCPECGNITAKA